jgi:hypothetical protein
MQTEPNSIIQADKRTRDNPISFLDLAFGFLPAFRDLKDGRTHLASTQEGNIASMHILDGLPLEWAEEIDTHGRIITLRDGIMAGFMRGERFFTLDELRARTADA